ncbi:MAG: ECF transporter S component [Calditrichaeota bacterium]|nr:ECF transporter S component [Calditrichota bacterium]
MKRSKVLARLSLLAALTVAGQAAGLPQPFTGPFVNAMLLVTVALVGWIPAVGLGCITPVVALLRGLLPAGLGLAVPVIALGNGLLVSAYAAMARLWGRPPAYPGALAGTVAVAGAALAKYLWLTLGVKVLLPFVLGAKLPPSLVLVLTTWQLFTALAGGFAALAFCAVLVRTGLLSLWRSEEGEEAGC